MEIKIRPAVQKDAPKILEMLCNIAALHHAGRPDIFADCGSKYGEAEIIALLADPTSPVLVAVDEQTDSAVGYTFCKLKETEQSGVIKAAKTLYIDDFYVDVELRGRSIGRQLFNAVKELAIRENCQRIDLNVWEFNQNAIKFYEAIGMTTQRRFMEYPLSE